MLRSKELFKSSPCLRSDPLEERYLDLRDQHQELRREARAAQDQIKILHAKLSRLIGEKKRLCRNVKSEREIMLEEQIFDLQHQLRTKTKQTEQLKDKIQLMRVQSGGDRRNLSAYHSYQSVITSTVDHNGHQHTSIHQSQQKHVPSAYSHVQSRTDSGLGVYFRPLNIKSRPKTSGSVRFREPTVEEIQDHSESTDIPFTATLLLQEAKQEIVRLESVVNQQKSLIESLKNGPSMTQSNSSWLESEVAPNSPNPITYTIATTSSTNSLTHRTSPNQLEPQSTSPHDESDSVDHLWSKYQQLVVHKESAQRISVEVQSIIERIYRSLKEEKQKVVSLQAKLAARQDMSSVIQEKEKQIETLRKENSILQSTLNRCADQCMDTETGDEAGHSDKYLERIQSVWNNRKSAYETQIEKLTEQVSSLDISYEKQVKANEQLQIQFDSLRQLNENDQLHIKHLEAKVSRLTAIVFAEQKIRKLDQHLNGDAKIEDEDASEPSSLNPEPSELTLELDQILNSLK